MNQKVEQIKNFSKIEKTAVIGLFGLILLSVGLYIFLIHGTIYNIVGEKRVSAEADALEARLIDLERDYFAKSNKINLKLATERGFQEVKSYSSYFVKADSTSVLTYGE